MTDFFRFPHTPHLAWLSEGSPRDDKVLSPAEAKALLTSELFVEEKLDGANLGISLAPDGMLRIQNRGQYLVPPYSGQFQRFTPWIARHQSALSGALGEGHILFGEWCGGARVISTRFDTPRWRWWQRGAGRETRFRQNCSIAERRRKMS